MFVVATALYYEICEFILGISTCFTSRHHHRHILFAKKFATTPVDAHSNLLAVVSCCFVPATISSKI